MENKHLQQAKEIESYLREIFFHLHQNPELGRKEYKTQAFVLSELKKMGVEAEPIADTGVVGLIRGAKPGKTIAFRGDMDALPIQEETGLPHQSKVPGVMHACGHDFHTTELLGVAKLFSAQRDKLCGNVKLLFQPNEEGNGGAERMVKAGCMENPHVDAVFFGHCIASPYGTVTVRNGAMSAASNPFSVVFRGKGTHGASPEKGTDTIVAACQVITALQTISSRRTSPTDSVLITVGAIHGGVEGNGSIIPETVKIDGIMRTLSPETRARAKADFYQIVTGVAESMGVKAEIDMRDGYTASINDDAMVEIMRGAAAKLFGSENVQTNPTSLGAEDVGFFMEKAPGCYYRFGVQNPNAPSYPLHNSRFAVDPEALPYGVALYMQIAEDFFKKN